MAVKRRKKGNMGTKATMLLATVAGAVATERGVNFLNNQNFMTKVKNDDDGNPKKNLKPTIASGVVTLGAGAGFMTSNNDLLSAFLGGVTSGGAITSTRAVMSLVKGKEAEGMGSVQHVLEMYEDLDGIVIEDLDGMADEVMRVAV